MRDTYQYWETDYAPPREEDIEPLDSDGTMERYIERGRLEFYEEWFEYLEEADQ